jgi:hypothetical protein
MDSRDELILEMAKMIKGADGAADVKGHQGTIKNLVEKIEMMNRNEFDLQEELKKVRSELATERNIPTKIERVTVPAPRSPAPMILRGGGVAIKEHHLNGYN